MPLKKPNGLGNLSCLQRQASFQMSETGTFSADGLMLGRSGILSGGSPHNLSGLTLDAIELGPQLGAGASSKVFKAMHKPSGTLLAIKMLQADLQANQEGRRMLLNEVKLVYTVHTDHLVRFYDAFLNEGLVYLVFEYMDFGSLENLYEKTFQRGQVVPDVVMGHLLVQMAQGLAFLHKERHAVHRDLKPGNVLVNSSGTVKLSDFGISKELGSTAALAATQCGTTNYMAPERIRGDQYSYSADIWSLGLIILEGMCGKFPYPAFATMFDVVKHVLEGPVPTENPEVQQCLPPDLLQLTHLTLIKDPTQRIDVLTLMRHPFIARHQTTPNTVGQFFLGVLQAG